MAATVQERDMGEGYLSAAGPAAYAQHTSGCSHSLTLPTARLTGEPWVPSGESGGIALRWLGCCSPSMRAVSPCVVVIRPCTTLEMKLSKGPHVKALCLRSSAETWGPFHSIAHAPHDRSFILHPSCHCLLDETCLASNDTLTSSCLINAGIQVVPASMDPFAARSCRCGSLALRPATAQCSVVPVLVAMRRFRHSPKAASTDCHRASTQQALPNRCHCVNATEWRAICLVTDIDHLLAIISNDLHFINRVSLPIANPSRPELRPTSRHHTDHCFDS